MRRQGEKHREHLGAHCGTHHAIKFLDDGSSREKELGVGDLLCDKVLQRVEQERKKKGSKEEDKGRNNRLARRLEAPTMHGTLHVCKNSSC